MKQDDAKRIVAYLAAAYPNQQLSRETVAVYLQGLMDEEYAKVMAGVKDLVKRSDFLPRLSEILRAASDVRREQMAAGDTLEAFDSLALPEHASGEDPNQRLQWQNFMRWKRGEITAAEMHLESARIYAEEGARPADGQDVLARAREDIAGFGGGDGPLSGHLRNIVRLPKRGSA